MDFRIFCKDESRELNFLKEYKGVLEKVSEIQNEPQYYTHRKEKELIKQRGFYGSPDEITKNNFETFKYPTYKNYQPYEDKYEVRTYCNKCDGRPCEDYIGDLKIKVKRKPSPKKLIPDHLMGRVVRQKSPPDIKEPDSHIQPKMLYKITIQTNDDQTSGTSAPVSVLLISKVKEAEPIYLNKKCGSLRFYFSPGSKEIFYVKSRVISVLKEVHVKLNAEDSEEEWRIDWISIEELGGEKRKWFCKIDRWLSSRREKCQLIAKLKPEVYSVPTIVYKIKVNTSPDSVEEFCGLLSLELHGSECKSDVKPLMVNERQRNIKKGSVTLFDIKCKEVGHLNAIKIKVEESVQSTESRYDRDDKSDGRRKSTLDTETKSTGWKDIKIDKVCIQWKGSDKVEHEIEFIMNDWIGLSPKMKKNYMVLKEPKDLKKQMNKGVKKQENSTYDVSFYTGKKKFSGTDSTVFLEFYGSYGMWSQKYDFVDYDKKKFESGKEDTFRITGSNVGSIDKIKISHNNVGIAPGWNLNKVNVVRHLTSREICDSLEDLKRTSTLPKEIKFQDGKVLRNQEKTTSPTAPSTGRNSKLSDNDKTVSKEDKQKGWRDGTSSQSSSESDQNDSVDVKLPLSKSTDDGDKHNDLLQIQLPYAEETTFICKKWITEKNSKKSSDVTMDFEKKTLLYSSISMLVNPAV